ncbi:uncharacterized protein RB166_016614 [Leptodactylus fuscus]|uniref:uncharacterized protein LOC142217418 n=1 Tax=Leptodactylus fuscus TaxID=238119 RepID=UPI003F4ED1A9
MAVVGISSRSSEKDLQWLLDFIRNMFCQTVADVKYLQITNNNSLEWERKVRSCSVGILYHTKRQGRLNITNVEGALYNEELKYLSKTLGRNNVLVVLDDLEKFSDSERLRILDSQPWLKDMSSDLLLFPQSGKTEEAYKKMEEFFKVFGNKAASGECQVKAYKSKVPQKSGFNNVFSYGCSKIISALSKPSPDLAQNRFQNGTIESHKEPMKSSLKVSIFSRSARSNYEWLMDRLKTTCMMKSDDLRAVYISNESTHFYSELRNCSFAILYHTQKRGRLNVTDVTDALYNVELKELSQHLGKENVIVVLDDLQKTDPTEKKRILVNQPSIGRLARDLFLFNETEKNIEDWVKIRQILKEVTRKHERWDIGPWTHETNDISGHSQVLIRNTTSPDPPQNRLQKDTVKRYQDIQPRKSRLKVSIFSRCARSNYDWLMDWLKTTCMIRSDDLRAVYITNKSTDLYSELQKCTFAILYHSLKQGRLNVTDVTDALYTEELKELSETLEKENVIVVMDDVQNTDPLRKKMILDNQPSIGRLATDLFLFNEKKDNAENLQKIKQILLKETQIDDIMDYSPSGFEPDFQCSPEPQQADAHADRVDDMSPNSGNSSTTHITEPICSYPPGLIKRDANGSGGPDRKKLHLDPKPAVQEDSTIQDVFPLPLLEKVNIINTEWKECQKIIQTEFTQRSQKLETLQKENGELQRQLKELSDAVAQKQLENRENIEKMEQRIQDLQKKLQEKEDAEKQSRKEAELTINTLHDDLYYTEKTIAENQGTIQMMEKNIDKLKRELQKKEDDERQDRIKTNITIEELSKDLHDKNRTIESKDERIQKMEQTFRQIKQHINETRTNLNQEQAGENYRKQQRQHQESQQYRLRNPISGQEDDEMSHSEHRGCKAHVNHEHSLVDRNQSRIDTVCQKQSPASANGLIDQLAQIINQKNEEIQKLQSVLEDTETLVCQILE